MTTRFARDANIRDGFAVRRGPGRRHVGQYHQHRLEL